MRARLFEMDASGDVIPFHPTVRPFLSPSHLGMTYFGLSKVFLVFYSNVPYTSNFSTISLPLTIYPKHLTLYNTFRYIHDYNALNALRCIFFLDGPCFGRACSYCENEKYLLIQFIVFFVPLIRFQTFATLPACHTVSLTNYGMSAR